MGKTAPKHSPRWKDHPSSNDTDLPAAGAAGAAKITAAAAGNSTDTINKVGVRKNEETYVFFIVGFA